jgi:hypothetical protein
MKKEVRGMADKTLICKECKNEFIFTERDQEFFKEKGFSEPMRCPTCRRARKNNQNRRNNDFFSSR